jgi:putative toxin-antitoxin system antitoxin component (TIGR02293 family)
MSAKPLAEIYEQLKESRRRGESDVDIPAKIGDHLLDIYDEVTEADARLQQRHRDLVVRSLDIRTLANRVFGEKEKADAWLQRPNAALSGQRPLNLLKDELGTAVVREMLERIDHGIFA